MERSLVRERILAEVDDVRERLIKLAESLHAHPEVSYEEEYAAKYIIDELRSEGFRIEEGTAGLATAFVARTNGRERPAVALLAEYDALPEIGHACGHNLIAAASVGAAIALARALPESSGQVILVGAPAEEVGGGKVDLVRAGVFESVDAAMMAHPSCRTYVGGTNRAFADIQIEFAGKASHAAEAAGDGVNALEAVLLTFSSVNSLRQHMRSDGHLHGIITAGGVRPNIVPERAVAQFYVRAADSAYVEQLVGQLRRCAEGAAWVTGATLSVQQIGNRYQAMRPSGTMAAVFGEHLSSLGTPVDSISPDGAGSTDMGDVSQALPSIHPHFDICGVKTAAHTVEFAAAANSDFAKSSMLLTAKALAMTAADVMLNPPLLASIVEEFKRRASSGT